METTSARESLWLDAPPTAYPKLTREIEADVAVVGGGITGLTTALLLKRQGARVAVLEAARVGSGVTGCTTAKVSALQATIYSTIRRRHSADKAAVYAEASVAGVEQLAALVADLEIDCDLARRTAFTYAATDSERTAVEQEAQAASEAGLAVGFTESTDLPYTVHGAVAMTDQLEIHPVRYVQALAAAVEGGGSAVYESSRVTGVESGSPCSVRTTSGAVRADRVVIATHYPILDRGGYFARLKPQRSYCIAARLRAGEPPRGMSISAGTPTRSVRSHRDLLIVGGEGHPTGSTDATPDRFNALEDFARRHWDVAEISHRWSAQDPVPYDHLPVIGPYVPGSSRLFVAAGFMKWGLATATFAGQLLADRIAGRDNPWASTFDPLRVSLRSTPELAKLGAKFSADLVVDRVRPAQAASAQEVPAGEARVVRDGLGKTGVYRDRNGITHAVTLRCPHMGCLLRFNAAETSWDCPCHGSRFGVDGRVLEGPATQPLARRDA